MASVTVEFFSENFAMGREKGDVITCRQYGAGPLGLKPWGRVSFRVGNEVSGGVSAVKRIRGHCGRCPVEMCIWHPKRMTEGILPLDTDY